MEEKDIKAIVARVAAEVKKEASVLEARFKVTDLVGKLTEFSPGGIDNSAWSISYSTSDAAIVRPGFESAWTISYSTSDAAILSRQVEK